MHWHLALNRVSEFVSRLPTRHHSSSTHIMVYFSSNFNESPPSEANTTKPRQTSKLGLTSQNSPSNISDEMLEEALTQIL